MKVKPKNLKVSGRPPRTPERRARQRLNRHCRDRADHRPRMFMWNVEKT